MASATNFVSYFTPILWFNKPFKELNFKFFHYGNFMLVCCIVKRDLVALRIRSKTVRSAMCFCFVSFLFFIGVIALSVY